MVVQVADQFGEATPNRLGQEEKKTMKVKIITELMSMLLKLLKPEMLLGVADKVLDMVEDKVEESSTDIDDKIILPLIEKIREAFNIPDED
jgi:hypothetical protein